MGIVFLVIALVLIGVGFALGLVAIAITAAFVGLGIVSSSVLIGLRSERPAAGIRAFLLQCGILAGVPAGAACAWLGREFFATWGREAGVLVFGALGGAIAGVVVALLLDGISRRVHTAISSRIARPHHPAIL